MAYTIAIAGKGGVGKTTLCGLLIQHLCGTRKGPILAVDADANSNLNEVLGVEVEETIGDIRESVARAEMMEPSPIPKGMSKQDYLSFRLESALVEEDDYDMVVMGRTQGSGCYCFVNGLLSAQIAKLSGNYEYIVVDNEAGMEHISRGILPHVDAMILVSDCSRRGIQAVGRIAGLVDECGLKPKAIGLIVNRAPDGKLAAGVAEEIQKQGLDLIGIVPHSEEVYELDCEGKATAPSLSGDSPVRSAFIEAAEKMLDL